MMKRVRPDSKSIFFITVFISSFFLATVFATQAEFKAIKELEEAEKKAPPEAIVRPSVEYNAQNLRDPFQVLTTEETEEGERLSQMEETPPPNLTVQGVIWGASFPQAIINNKVVKVGDTIDGARVVNIDKDGVVVFFEGRQYNLPSPAAKTLPNKKPQGG